MFFLTLVYIFLEEKGKLPENYKQFKIQYELKNIKRWVCFYFKNKGKYPSVSEIEREFPNRPFSYSTSKSYVLVKFENELYKISCSY